MWSKTQKAMYERLTPSLRERVKYEVQNYQHLKCDCGVCASSCKQFAIIIDRKEVHTIGGAGAFYQQDL